MMKGKGQSKWQLGSVTWFNDGLGEGMIRTENGRDYFVHYSVIKSEKKRKTLKANQKVRVLVRDDEYSKFVKKLTL